MSAAAFATVGRDHAAPARLPGSGALAKQIRDGATVRQLAEDYGVTSNRVRLVVYRGGWSAATGLPRVDRPKDPMPGVKKPPEPDRSWMDRAACNQMPDFTDRDQREAARVCNGCPVVADCLAYAQALRIHHFVWGGLTDQQRAQLRRRTLRKRSETL